LAILIAGGGFLAITDYGRAALGHHHSAQRMRAAIVIGLATLVVLVPLAAAAIRVGRDSALEASVDTEATQALRGTSLQLHSVTSSNGTVQVVVAGDQNRSAGVAGSLATTLSADHPEAKIEVRLVPSLLSVAVPHDGLAAARFGGRPAIPLAMRKDEGSVARWSGPVMSRDIVHTCLGTSQSGPRGFDMTPPDLRFCPHVRVGTRPHARASE
jgi:hypothetical protein